MRFFIGVGAIASVLFFPSFGEAQQASLIAAIKAVDTQCDAANFQSQTASTSCYNSEERSVWVKNAPEALPYFDKWAAYRSEVAANVDSKTITIEQGLAWLSGPRKDFESQIAALGAQEDRERDVKAQRAIRRAAQRQQDFQNAALAISSYYKARADAIASQPKTTHTSCGWIADTWNCTTTPY